jgi:hypothetical protein
MTTTIFHSLTHQFLFLVPCFLFLAAEWSIEERLCLFKLNLQLDGLPPPMTNIDTDTDKSITRPISSSGHVIHDPKTVTLIGSFNDDTDTHGGYDEKIEHDSNCNVNNNIVGSSVHGGSSTMTTQIDPYTIRPRQTETETEIETQLRKKRTVATVEEMVSMRPVCVPKVDLVQSKHLPGKS